MGQQHKDVHESRLRKASQTRFWALIYISVRTYNQTFCSLFDSLFGAMMLRRGLFGVLLVAVAVGTACNIADENRASNGSNGMGDTGETLDAEAGADTQGDVQNGDISVDVSVTDTQETDTSTADTSSRDAQADATAPDTPEVDTVDTPFAAFPEAEGFGSVSTGGRGGQVIQVTNLDDSGPGSFRAAAEASGPRTIVFRVGGTITLESNVEIREPFVTIAGHTAPGDGILLRGNGARSLNMLRVFTHDVIIRHLRFRRGPSTNGGECSGDTISLFGADRVIVDHVSAGWTTDQIMSMWPATNVTIQESLMSEALHNSTHSDDCSVDGPLQPHALGPLVGQESTNITFFRNVFANNVGRNPQIKPTSGSTVEVVNNVVYNVCYAISLGGAGEDYVEANAIGNYIKWGPQSCSEHRNNILLSGNVRAYLEDNLTPARTAGDDEWLASSEFHERTPALTEFQSTERFTTLTSRIVSAEQAYAEVPDTAGARLVSEESGEFRTIRFPVDQRSIDDLRSGTATEGTTGRRLDHPDDVGGWPAVAGGTAYPDADEDGMPDGWETTHGLDPANADDRNDDPDQDGYTNLEEFLNGTLPG
jgi:pectate lyase